MQIASPRQRPIRESVVPMINVVFLLLVFFLMTSQIAPPDPVEVALPGSATGSAPEGGVRLFIGRDGIPHFESLSGEAVFAALSGREMPAGPLLMSADGAVEAAHLATILRRLAALGITEVELAVAPQ